MEKAYKKQVALLLSVLPEVAKETCFALHGGTAINLFVRDMPRLSVDIDLTYIPIEDRATSFANIAKTLEKIKASIEATIPNVTVSHKQEICKLLISLPEADIKLEVNQIGRGVLSEPVKMTLCEKAQNDFDSYCVVPAVPLGQLYGGKICAAIDRQHPRDLFDVKYLFQNEGFSEEIKKGFLLCLLSSARPIHELISPNFQDQRLAMKNQFEGMSSEAFTYEEYENVRAKLVDTINNNLTEADRNFLLSFKNLTPNWNIYDFQSFPAVQWKSQNLQNLQAKEPNKHKEQYAALKKILGF